MDFSFVQITDHHLRETEAQLSRGYSTAYAFRTVMRHIAEHAGNHIDFVVSTGDLVDDGTDESYQNLCHILNIRTVSPAPGPQIVSCEGLHEVPMYFVPGNHDDRTNFFRYLSSQTPPMPLMNTTFQHKGIQFITLDWGPHDKAVAHPETLAFLAETLRNGLPSVLLMHYHLVPIDRTHRWVDRFLPDNNDAFWEIVKGHNVLGMLCGHAHATYDKLVSGIPVLGLRSTAPQFATTEDGELLICMRPPHYRLVTIRDGVLTTRIFEVRL